MTRARFNTTCDLIYGASGASPGSVYASGPCRYVAENFELPLISPLSARIAYVTLDFAAPNQGHVSGTLPTLTTDYSFADIVAVPSGASGTLQVLFVETVNYPPEAVYYRAHVHLYSSTPPVSGCYGCALSPGRWLVSWSGGPYSPPFDVGSSAVMTLFAGPAGCEWEWNPTMTLSVFLTISMGPQQAVEFTNGGSLVARWQPLLSWNCMGVNTVTILTITPGIPTTLTLTPI